MTFNIKDYSTKNKLIITIVFVLAVSMSVVTIYSTVTLRNALIENSKKETLAIAEKYSGLVKSEIETALDATRTYAQVLSAVHSKDNPLELNRNDVILMNEEIAKQNPFFIGVATIYRKNAFDGEDENHTQELGSDSVGQFAPYVFNDGQGDLGMINVDIESFPKQKDIEVIIDPKGFPLEGGDSIHIITAISPIMKDSVRFGNVASFKLQVEVF